jgi:predicted small secreted protein
MMNPATAVDWNAVSAHLSSHRAQLVLTAVASGVVVGSTILAFQSARHNEKLKNIKRSIRRRSDATAVWLYFTIH